MGHHTAGEQTGDEQKHEETEHMIHGKIEEVDVALMESVRRTLCSGHVGFRFGLFDDAITVGVHLCKLLPQPAPAQRHLFVLRESDLAILVQIPFGEHLFLEARIDLPRLRERDRSVTVAIESTEQPWQTLFVDFVKGKASVLVGVCLDKEVTVGFPGCAGCQ